MSTNSNIAMKKEDESIISIYCHWDGYPSNQMPILENYYNTKDKVEELISLGNLSYLEKSCKCPEGHTFEKPIDGYCLAYGQDRGEDHQEPQLFYSESDWLFRNSQQYNYLFENNEWKCIKR